MLARNWDRPLDQARLLLQLYPSTFWGHFILGVTYREKRMLDEAVSAHRTALEVSGCMPGLIGWLGLTLGLNGSAAEARSLLDRPSRQGGPGICAAVELRMDPSRARRN